MNPTVIAVRITGHGADRLTLHTTQEQADAALVAAYVVLWGNRFAYRPQLTPTPTDARELLEREGWTVRVEDLPVEL